MATKVRIGEIIESYWDDQEKCVRFVIEMDGSRRKVAGRIQSGLDHETQAYISSADLKKKAKTLMGLVVYDRSGKIDPANITYEDLQELRFKISLSDMNVSAVQSTTGHTLNSFLSRL